jgi:hypothetical protein
MNDLLHFLVAVALLVHGLSHIIWFLVAWTPHKLGVEDGPWILPGEVTLTSVVGHIIGLIALLAMVSLVLAGIALLMQEEWWRGAARWGYILSFIVVLPWYPRIPRRIGLQAIIINIMLMFLIALPLSIDITTI